MISFHFEQTNLGKHALESSKNISCFIKSQNYCIQMMKNTNYLPGEIPCHAASSDTPPARHAPGGHEEDAHVSVYVLLLLVFPSVDPSSSSLLLLSRTTDDGRLVSRAALIHEYILTGLTRNWTRGLTSWTRS